ARRLTAECEVSHRPVFRLCGADPAQRRRAASALSAENLAEQARIRSDRAQAGWHVPEELRAVRRACGSRRARRGPGSADLGRIGDRAASIAKIERASPARA